VASPTLDIADPLDRELWDECGEHLWLHHSLAETHGQARYLAWSGRCSHSDYVLAGEPFKSSHDLLQLRVRKRWLHFDPEPYGDWWPWKQCERDEADAVSFWEITLRPENERG